MVRIISGTELLKLVAPISGTKVLIFWELGFIKPSDGGEDLFCHATSIKDGNCLHEGDTVEYEAEFDEAKGKYRAIEVTGGHQDDDAGRGSGGKPLIEP